ncbi:MAG: trypsin-like peptidase domain-containing protein [Tenericutes bacterium]|nr:trypsin-like peptidase domain-containing protein [Mycoplasmatota bacterium]
MKEKIEVSENKEVASKTQKSISKKRKSKKIHGILITIFVVLIAFVLGLSIMYLYSKNNPTVITSKKTVSEIKVSEEAMEDAIDKVYDSVLCIQVLDQSGNVISSGSGFVYSKDSKYGYILTNSHVVSGATTVQGVLSNNNTVELKVLGTDSYTDLAVLRMDAKDVLGVASIGKSSNVKVGNTVFTVGSPMGSNYSGTVTKGILSGKDRLIETSSSTDSYTTESYIVKVMQTDAAISPGNSGGPLVDLAGDVIGINSLKLVDSSVEGLGFAIPIEDAMSYVDTLAQGKKVERPILGVQILDLTNKLLLQRYGINYDSSINEGIILVKVNGGYPASDAGLKNMDVVTKINGEKVTTTSQFKYELYKYSIGDTIEVTYVRNGKEKTTKIKLDKSK